VTYSQFDDERIIAHILNNIGVCHRRCCEVGASDGLHHSNTAWLVRECGWHGTFIECDEDKTGQCRDNYEAYDNAVAIHDRATVENINDLVPDELDFLSIDVDGNDYYLWEALASRPRLICIEYNERKTGLDVQLYCPKRLRSEIAGASPAALILLAEEKDCVLVTGDYRGNLFFVPRKLHESLALIPHEAMCDLESFQRNHGRMRYEGA